MILKLSLQHYIAYPENFIPAYYNLYSHRLRGRGERAISTVWILARPGTPETLTRLYFAVSFASERDMAFPLLARLSHLRVWLLPS
jgi:hypothetical protein